MRNQELKKMLHELNEKLGKILEDQGEEIENAITDRINEALNEECFISITKDKYGKAVTKAEGSTLAILVTLAGLEKALLRETHVPSNVWEMIKDTVGAREVD